MVLLLVAGCGDRPTKEEPVLARSRIVRVPEDAATLADAIARARSQDTILVSDGLYSGEGNRDLHFGGKSLVLRSENGPERTIIDCGGSSASPHFGIEFRLGDRGTVDGLTIRNGYSNHGSAIRCQSASPTLRNCVFFGNHATDSGGALRCKNASPTLVHCTLAGNSSVAGGGMFLIAGSSPRLEGCIIALSRQGGAVFVNDASCRPRLICCDLFGNAGGDWIEDIADQAGESGNISLDPLFCDPVESDLHLRPGSPCAADSNSCSSPMGALGVGCRADRAGRLN